MSKLYQKIVIAHLPLIFCVFITISPTHLYANTTLTWSECVRMTLENNPELAMAHEKTRQAETNKTITEKSSDIHVDSNANYTSTRTKNSKKDADDEDVKNYAIARTYNANITAKKILFDGFKTATKTHSAAKTVEAQTFAYRVVSSNIRLHLRTAFIELLKTQKMAIITQRILKRSRDNFRLVVLSFNAGREHHGSVLAVYADVSRSALELIKIHRSLSLWKKRLEKEIGVGLPENTRVIEKLSVQTPRSRKPDFGSLTDNSPFLKNLIALKDAARINIETTKADFYPEVYASSSIGRTSTSLPVRRNEMSLGFGISLPLWDGYDRQGRLDNARSSFREIHAEVRNGRMGVLYTLEEKWVGLQNGINDIQSKGIQLKATEERANIMRKKYFSGLASFDDWSMIENDLASATTELLITQADALIKEAEWFQAKGGSLEDEN